MDSHSELNIPLIDKTPEASMVLPVSSELLRYTQVEREPGCFTNLPRLPLILLLQPLLTDNVPNVYNIDLLDTNTRIHDWLSKLFGDTDALSIFEQKCLTLFGSQQRQTSVHPLTINDPQDSHISYHIRSTLARQTIVPTPQAHISISADDPDNLFKACFFEGQVYLIYGDSDKIVLKPFDLRKQMAPHCVRYEIANQPFWCLPKGNNFKLRSKYREYENIDIYDYLDGGEQCDRVKSVSNRNYIADRILPSSSDPADISQEMGIKILQAARHELLNNTQLNTPEQAKIRRDETKRALEIDFPSQATSTIYSTFV